MVDHLARTVELDVTPEWRPGMTPVAGMAAHRSMQRLSNDEIIEARAHIDELRDNAIIKFGSGDELDRQVASYDRRIAAYDLALAWRNGRQS